MTFTIEINEQIHLDGITKAREAYNASLPYDSSDRLDTNGEYVQFVMASAAESYSKQYPVE
ncbi:MAG: hypothetical protein EBR82_60105 [Caulobacteraceae bacterium]|nr:hypothetical protein [Caulobacteraceae bacterium]